LIDPQKRPPRRRGHEERLDRDRRGSSRDARLVLERSTEGEGAPDEGDGIEGRIAVARLEGARVRRVWSRRAGLAIGTVMMMVNRGNATTRMRSVQRSASSSKRAEVEDLTHQDPPRRCRSSASASDRIGVGAVLLVLGKGSGSEPVRAKNGFRSFGLSGTF
jgi:hypothetical protein